MNVKEYVAIAKAELDSFQRNWEEKMVSEPGNYPSDLEEGEWGDQELASRFGAVQF